MRFRRMTMGKAAVLGSWSLSRRWTIALAVLLVALELIVSEPRGWFMDFRHAYYPAGVAALDGTSLLNTLGKGVEGFVNLPIVAYVFAPFGVLSWQFASVASFMVGLVVTAAAFIVVARAAGIRHGTQQWMLLLLLFFINGPLINNLKFGNTSNLALLAVAGVLCLFRGQRSTLAGALLALAGLLKLPLLLLGVIFLIRRDWRGLIAFGAVIAAAALLSVAVFGPALHVFWFQTSILQFAGKTIPAFNVQTVSAFLVRLRDPAPALYHWALVGMTAPEQLATRCVQLAVGLTACAGLWMAHLAERRGTVRDEATALQLLILLNSALLLSPLIWSHYYCWFLIGTAYVVQRRCGLGISTTARRLGWIAIWLTTPLVLFPYSLLASLDPLYTRLAVSNYLFGGFVWLAALVVAARTLARNPSGQVGI